MPTSTYTTTREAAALADRLAEHGGAHSVAISVTMLETQARTGVPAHPCAAAPSVTPLRRKDPTCAARQRRYDTDGGRPLR